jgi:tetratricopeptide (TPR) repeat protein
MQKHTKAFSENLSIIFDELYLAEYWEKAVIIFTIHKDIFSQAKTKNALSKKLEKNNNNCVEIEIDKVGENLIEYLLDHQDTENTIFFISNIDRGGGEEDKALYKILNIHRETFIEEEIKVIFFLTQNEASELASYAPDFWAFRHRVLEFSSSTARNKKKPPVGVMLWQLEPFISQNVDSESNVSSLIRRAENIPEQPESVAFLIDVEYELGYMCWLVGDLVGAEKNLEKGLDLAEVHSVVEARTKIINGLAIIKYERENYQESMEMLEPLVKENPRDCVLILNHAISTFALNKRYEALKNGLKAKKLCANNPWMLRSLGFLHYFAGRMEKAVACFQRAVEISPTNGIFHEALVVCYLAMGLKRKAIVQLDQVRKDLVERKLFYDILKVFVEDKKENALLLIKEAINDGKLSKQDFVREPCLYALFDSIEVIQT